MLRDISSNFCQAISYFPHCTQTHRSDLLACTRLTPLRAAALSPAPTACFGAMTYSMDEIVIRGVVVLFLVFFVLFLVLPGSRRRVGDVVGLRFEYYDATCQQWRCLPSLAELSVLEREGPPRSARTTTSAARRRRR